MLKSSFHLISDTDNFIPSLFILASQISMSHSKQRNKSFRVRGERQDMEETDTVSRGGVILNSSKICSN